MDAQVANNSEGEVANHICRMYFSQETQRREKGLSWKAKHICTKWRATEYMYYVNIHTYTYMCQSGWLRSVYTCVSTHIVM